MKQFGVIKCQSDLAQREVQPWIFNANVRNSLE